MPATRRSVVREQPSRVRRNEALYVESSAVLRVLLERDGALVTALRQFRQYFTSSLTLVEVARALSRGRRERRITQDAYARAHRKLNRFAANCAIIELTRAIRERAMGEFPAEPVRSLDAIHLATLTTHAELFPSVVVASCDARIRDNALALGYEVVP
jgi:predicted nucleic acid-binding protein